MLSRMRRVFTLSLANVVGTLHAFLIGYIASSYLEQFLPTAYIGLVFSISAALMILGFVLAPLLLSRFPVRRIALSLAGIDLITVLVLINNPSARIAIALIALQGALVAFIAYTLDLFLERATTHEEETGSIRGLFLTSGNIAIVLGPLLLGVILDGTNAYERVFSASAVALVAFIALVVVRRRFIVDIKPSHSSSLFSTLHCLLHVKELRAVLIANTLLQCFFIWATIYIPLYLHVGLGISWDILGPLFALALLPFLIIELPMGYFEDHFHHARLVMTLGFLVIGAAFMSLSFINAGTSLALIVTILLLTRVGAALIEITSETNFFRAVSSRDTESIGYFRMTRPLGALIGSVVGSLFLFFLPLQYLFVPLGGLLLLGIPFALRIKNA